MQESNHFGLEYDVVDRGGKYNADRLMVSLGIRKLTIVGEEASCTRQRQYCGVTTA